MNVRKNTIITGLLLLLLCTGFRSPNTSDKSGLVEFLLDYLSIKYANKTFNEFLYVAVQRQQLFHVKNHRIVGTFNISTSKYGIGCESGSEKTPIGLHTIDTKIGDGAPIGTIFKERRNTGRVATIVTAPTSTNTDDVTTRILWLKGMESGLNRGGRNDSKSRCIYIHGTPEEGLLGTPASHGCIRMKNTEVADLYEAVQEGMYVVILNN